MAFTDEVRSKSGRPGIACWGEQLQERDPDLYVEIVECMEQGLQYAAVGAALRDRGFMVSATSLSRHHRGQCACPS